MLLNNIHLKGFRNFKDCKVNFSPKTLIIGANDVGKSNLLYALRLLLDKSLSEADITPVDTDFFAYEETNEFKITAHFSNIDPSEDECIISYFRGDVSDDGELFLQFVAKKEKTGGTDYKIYAGRDLDNLQEFEGRYYLRRLNLEYLSSYRDLKSYIKKEQKTILEEAKEIRSKDEEDQDNKNNECLEKDLSEVTKRIKDFSYIKSATQKFNTELSKLSAENENREISFDAGATDTDKFINNLTLVSQRNGKSLAPGGDGRNNQIFLSMWASRKQNNESEITLFAIEEPEAHLHPHQQRRLSEYLSNDTRGQLIITSHSPQIASEFNPNSIVRLFTDNLETKAANDGCSTKIEDASIKFAHRMSILPAEVFFSDFVLLVEGVSEVLFFKSLAKALNKDLDHHNISILSVEGVGFTPYIELLNELGIPFCMRTDNDCFKVPNKDKYRNAGLERIVSHLLSATDCPNKETIKSEFNAIYYQDEKEQNSDAINFYNKYKGLFEEHGLFLSNIDLENDLINSSLNDKVLENTESDNNDSALATMVQSKGAWMFGFIKDNEANLKKLAGSDFEKPINYCLSITSEINETDI